MMIRTLAVVVVGGAGAIPVVGVLSSTKPTSTGRTVRPSQLPIYEGPEDLYHYEYYVAPSSALEGGVRDSRRQVKIIAKEMEPYKEKAWHIYETGKAHTLQSLDYLMDETNLLPRVGAITLAGLAGFLIASRKKGLLRRLLYTSIGSGAMASLCYPKETISLSNMGYAEGKKYASIGYNFIVGVKPEEVTKKEAVEVKKETKDAKKEVKEEKKATPEPKKESSEKKMDKVAEQVSDVGYWGFRLLQPETDLAAKPEKHVDYGQSNKEDKDMYTTRGH